MHDNNLKDRGPPCAATTYDKPKLERLGSFRELTQSGGTAFSDMWTTDGTGCTLTGSSSYTCYKP